MQIKVQQTVVPWLTSVPCDRFFEIWAKICLISQLQIHHLRHYSDRHKLKCPSNSYFAKLADLIENEHPEKVATGLETVPFNGTCLTHLETLWKGGWNNCHWIGFYGEHLQMKMSQVGRKGPKSSNEFRYLQLWLYIDKNIKAYKRKLFKNDNWRIINKLRGYSTNHVKDKREKQLEWLCKETPNVNQWLNTLIWTSNACNTTYYVRLQRNIYKTL